ncbi:MAG: DUF4347 domain-containing protein [Desulfoplanes sp.]|nr:DUF4347 domain-containing protein [Desulfoplanes sp.]
MASLNKKASVKVWHKGLIAQLEPRLMYDGAAGVVAVEVMDTAHDSDTADTSHDVTDSHVLVATEQGTAETPDAGPEIAAVLDALESSPEIRCEIAFVDASVQDADTLIAGLDSSMEVYQLDATESGLSQMADILAGRQGVDAIHIFSHGSSGEITLGTENINGDNAETMADDFATIGQAMDADGDILIYGCNVGQDSAFVEQIAELTGADVAASDDATGASDLGGDWVLEKSDGIIETTSLSPSGYNDLLGTTLLNNLGGSYGFGENAHSRNDDIPTSSIDITSVFGTDGVKFGDAYYTNIYINNNGVVNFGSATSSFTPNGLSSGVDGTPSIAVYWTDLDTRSGTVSTSSGGTSQGTNLVYWDIDTSNQKVVITWDDVAEYSCGSSSKIAAQVVLENAGNGDMDFSLRYEYAETLDTHSVQAGWNIGVSGGTSGVDYYEIPLNGSGSSALNDLDTRAGNTGVTGLWEFSLRDGGVSDASAAEFSSIIEDPAVNNGQQIDSVFGKDIAVSQVDDTHGDWQYSLDNKNTWTSFSASNGSVINISDSARLLDTTDFIRFIPDSDWNGETSVEFYTWNGEALCA